MRANKQLPDKTISQGKRVIVPGDEIAMKVMSVLRKHENSKPLQISHFGTSAYEEMSPTRAVFIPGCGLRPWAIHYMKRGV